MGPGRWYSFRVGAISVNGTRGFSQSTEPYRLHKGEEVYCQILCLLSLSLTWFNFNPSIYMHQWTGSALVQVMANADLLLTGPLGTNFSEIEVKITKVYIHENAFENILFKMAAILSRGRWVDMCCPDNAWQTRSILWLALPWQSLCGQIISNYDIGMWNKSMCSIRRSVGVEE